mmetsp:Transcript_40424/g.79103  ORF Transcript_40424/g.79103 Transcript_40424/m.79103 type:complete len:1645 (-) Transcript_40424:50-4984(-)
MVRLFRSTSNSYTGIRESKKEDSIELGNDENLIGTAEMGAQIQRSLSSSRNSSSLHGGSSIIEVDADFTRNIDSNATHRRRHSFSDILESNGRIEENATMDVTSTKKVLLRPNNDGEETTFLDNRKKYGFQKAKGLGDAVVKVNTPTRQRPTPPESSDLPRDDKDQSNCAQHPGSDSRKASLITEPIRQEKIQLLDTDVDHSRTGIFNDENLSGSSSVSTGSTASVLSDETNFSLTPTSSENAGIVTDFSPKRISLMRRPRLPRSMSPHARLYMKRHGSRSRSRSQGRNQAQLVFVTSRRSSKYKNAGTTSRLDKRAPAALKTFHELAMGIKDAYEATGTAPKVPCHNDQEGNCDQISTNNGASMSICEFLGNLDFLLAVVDEVATDKATRGALKDDATFKELRHVIKKGNKILDSMLIKRENKNTLFFRLVTVSDTEEVKKIESWNSKVEKAVGAVADKTSNDKARVKETPKIRKSSFGSAFKNTCSLPLFSSDKTSARISNRRPTPTPALRKSFTTANSTNAAEDGFSVSPALNPLEIVSTTKPFRSDSTGSCRNPALIKGNVPSRIDVAESASLEPIESSVASPGGVKPVQAKEELVDVIRGLRVEKLLQDARANPHRSQLKPGFKPKARIPNNVPELPYHYIHRHRLMLQVINSLCDRNGTCTRDVDDDQIPYQSFITSVTSRHTDKAGNGKTVLASAVIQTEAMRERFHDGIVWLKLGKGSLSEADVRRLYEDMYRQLIAGKDPYLHENDCNESNPDEAESEKMNDISVHSASYTEDSVSSSLIRRSRRYFQYGDLEGIKEDLIDLFESRNILIVLDDVYRAGDARWFLLNKLSLRQNNKNTDVDPDRTEFDESSLRVLITTRFPKMFDESVVHEIFVRIMSEDEAVKLLLTSAGRKPFEGKKAICSHVRDVVKGCGNSPLALTVAGGTLRKTPNWSMASSCWKGVMEKCRDTLEEAADIRSFSKALGRLVDFSFHSVVDPIERAALRRCFVAFSLVFDQKTIENVKGISKAVVLGLFSAVLGVGAPQVTAESVLKALLYMNLLKTAVENADKIQEGNDLSDSAMSKVNPKDKDKDKNGYFPSSGGPRSKNKKKCDLTLIIMHESIQQIGIDMAKRTSASYEEEQNNSWSKPLRHAAKYLAQLAVKNGGSMAQYQFHEIMASSLTGILSKSEEVKLDFAVTNLYDIYVAKNLPHHLIMSRSWKRAGEVLSDKSFISKRVHILGSINATRFHVTDLTELFVAVSSIDPLSPRSPTTREMAVLGASNHSGRSSSSEFPGFEIDDLSKTSKLLVDGFNLMLDEVIQVESTVNSEDLFNINVGICLSFIGSGLLACQQSVDAMCKLEESVGIYRSLLGYYHVDVARSLNFAAKAYLNMGERRIALLKHQEAARIYEACNVSEHFDAVTNIQSIAAISAELGFYKLSIEKYEEVISIRRSIYGERSSLVAQTLHDYARVLSMHGSHEKALELYKESRMAYETGCSSTEKADAALVTLSMAAVKSRQGDVGGAIEAYEQGSKEFYDLIKIGGDYMRHYVTSMENLATLKMGQKDFRGSLQAYQLILDEISMNKSPSLRLEAAKLHVRSATIINRNLKNKRDAIFHLREALPIYKDMYGESHRDTLAVLTTLQKWEMEETSVSTKP